MGRKMTHGDLPRTSTVPTDSGAQGSYFQRRLEFGDVSTGIGVTVTAKAHDAAVDEDAQ
jgi:hypothetical protein